MSDDKRFVILGTGGFFTYQVIKRLLELNSRPLAYIQYGFAAENITSQFADIEIENRLFENSLTSLLKKARIPQHYHSTLDLAEFIAELNTDFLLLACWPTLIPQRVISAVNIAALNLHPSLLPRFRGIDPITDQLNTDERKFGISLHLLNDQYDCGDIVLQQALPTSPQTKEEIETACAIKGAELFLEALATHTRPGWKLIKQWN